MDGKLHYLLSLIILLTLLALALASPYGRQQSTIEVEPRHYAVIVGDPQIAVYVLPLLLSLAAALGGVGSIQSRVALPNLIRRSVAWAFAFGMAFHGLAHYWLATNNVFDFHTRNAEARWIGFAGTVLLLCTLLANIVGLVRHRRVSAVMAQQESVDRLGGTDMTARIYAWGGLLLLLWMTLRISQWVWPWLPLRSVGLTAFNAAMFTYPLTIALGAVALLLSQLQSSILLAPRLKAAGAVLYLSGTAVFCFSMFEDLRRDRPWDTPFSWSTSFGLALLLLALLVNLIGLIRNSPNAAAKPASLAN